MAFETSELKHIAHFAAHNNCVPQMSTKPNIKFIEKGTKREIIKTLSELASEYTQSKNDERVEKSRIRRDKERNTPYKEQYQ